MCIGSSVAIGCADAVGARCRVVIGGLVTGGLMLGVAGLVIGAGVARADVYGTRATTTPTRSRQSSPQTAGLARTQSRATAIDVCFKHAQGWSRDQQIDQLEQAFSSKLAIDFVMGSEFHFCPAFDSPHVGDDGGPPRLNHGWPAPDGEAQPRQRDGLMIRTIFAATAIAAATFSAASTATAEPTTPTPTPSPGPTALCNDNTWSNSQHRSGTCAHHGGVKQWCPCGSGTGQIAIGPYPR